MKAVVLLSGGMDSCTVLGLAKRDGLEEGFECHALSFDYGQRHKRELSHARVIAKHYNVSHQVLDIDLRQIGGSALTSNKIKVPKDRSLGEMSLNIPSTYVPSRNIILLSYASAVAQVIGARHIYIGVNQLDYSGYPDCRHEFIDAFVRALNVGTKAAIEGHPFMIHAPLMHQTKTDIVKMAAAIQAPLELTWSCYSGGMKACGRCDSCILRLKGFAGAGMVDPCRYSHIPEGFKRYANRHTNNPTFPPTRADIRE